MRGQRLQRDATAAASATRPFVGRKTELSYLCNAVDDAGAGRGGVMLVTGEAGIGKTRLMQEVGGWASEKGWRVLVGRCWEEGGAPAYWPWIQVVREAGGDFEQLPGPAGTPVSVDPESRRFALFDSATRFLIDRARQQPLLLLLDDLHAADAPSLLLLRFLGETIADSPILVVGSYREGERRVRELADSFAGLARVARRISLRGLNAEEVETYLAGSGGSRSAAARLQAITGGNPFFLGEIVGLLARDGRLDEDDAPTLRVPDEVRALVRRRVSQVSPDAIDVLRIAAVIGRGFDLRTLELASELGPRRLLDLLAEGIDAGALADERPFAGHFTFTHELVRETLYEDLPPGQRLEIHLGIARAIEEQHRGDPDPRLEEIAHHLALAAPLGDTLEAVDYLTRAGDRASEMLAYEEAATHYERALQLLSTVAQAPADRRCELLLRLGDALWRAGNLRRASASFEEAVRAARLLQAPEIFAEAALGYVIALGGFLLMARVEAGAMGMALLEEALAALPRRDSRLRANLLAHLAMEMLFSGDVERRVALSREAIEMARRLGDADALVTALHCSHWALGAPDMVDDRLANTREMLDVAARSGDDEVAFLAHNARFHCFLELCDAQQITREIEAMSQLSERLRQPVYRWHTDCVRVIRATLDGRFDEAERLGSSALGQGMRRHSEYADFIFRFAQTLAIRWAQGRVGEMSDAIREHGERFPWIPRWRHPLEAAELGDSKTARMELERCARRDFTELPRDGLWILHLCSLAEACALLADLRRAERLYDLLLPFADRNAVSVTQQPFGPVALRLGMLATTLERWDDAERHFATALERCRDLGARAVSARVLYEHARMLVARGDEEARASAVLDEAAGLCDELGMPGVRDRVEALAESLREISTPDATLRREGDIWTIAFAGQTVRMRDAKGLRYIAILLAAPGSEIHAGDLVRAVEGAGPAPSAPEPVLDAPAKDAYRRRLEDLGEDLEQARDWGDPERVVRIELEIEALTVELARAAGLRGRDRELASPAERARVSVTKAIRTTIRAIDKYCPALGAHLAASIHTGRFCSYAPPGEAPPHWAL
jgi:eukaryotic-like serine/threonine-protein kinase